LFLYDYETDFLQGLLNNNNRKILVTVTQSVTNVSQTNNTSTSGMNEE
jgi:hypothetical protein